MSVRSRLAEAPVPVAKVFGPGVPAAIEAAEARSQMTPSSPFGPGEPIGPYDGFSRTPRSREFVTSVNTSSRPRSHERVSFETLKAIIRSYDVAQICIRHRIASLRSLDWKLIAADGYDGDVTADIAEGKRVLKRPDRKTLFKPWLAKYLRDVLSYDAGTLYKMRNRAGRPVGLKVVDGTMIAPLLDYWGDSPDAPAPAYVQYVNGLPWNWLTRDDLIYEPYDPQADSIYGLAPMEDVLLNANTDIRFQLYFLQRFTEGNLPAAFASAPDSWSPEQIEQFQELWDAFMAGDQSRKHQIRWLPPGSKIAWSNEKDFSDSFSLFLMRKTCASLSVVPADLGFTETVNRSSGESQADVQHRVGDLPLAHHVQDILSAFIQDDLQLPLQFSFDLGEEQDDRVAQAQADDIYLKAAVVGSSEIREMRYGRSDPVPIPRYIYTERAGPIPVSSLLAVAGEIDPATALPAPGSPLPREVFGGTEGVLPNPPIKVMSLAEREFGEAAMPPAPPPQPKMTPDEAVPDDDGALVVKDGEASAGITSETGLTSYDLIRDDEDEADRQATVAKEMAAFRRFRSARRKAGEWRDFEFRSVAAVRGHNLNDTGRLTVRKDAGQVAVAGLAVLAADTGRVLMLQRALDDTDPAAGTWEFPGGHIEGTETPLRGAWREWAEETGCVPPPGVQTGTWTSPDGIYQGIVWTIDAEASVPVRSDTAISNPDDPDGDCAEAVAWWNPETLPGNPVVRPELLAGIGAVMAALGSAPEDAGPGEVAKAGDAGPKRSGPSGDGRAVASGHHVVDRLLVNAELGSQVLDGLTGKSAAADLPHHVIGQLGPVASSIRKAPARDWHGWKLDRKTAAHWAPQVRDAVTAAVPKDKAREIGRDYLADHPGQDGKATGKRDRNKAAAAWLAGRLATQGTTLVPASLGQGIAADGYMIGAASAASAVSGDPADTGGWQPGGTSAAQKRIEELGLGAALLALLGGGAGAGAGGPAAAAGASVASGYLGSLAIILAGTDADWADSRETLDELGDMLSGALADEETAVTLVGTEINIFTGLAAHAYYLANTVSLLSWITEHDARVCPTCFANEAASPLPAGQPFPSGHLYPPAHNRCRCAIWPEGMGGAAGIPGLPGGGEDAAEGAESAEDGDVAEESGAAEDEDASGAAGPAEDDGTEEEPGAEDGAGETAPEAEAETEEAEDAGEGESAEAQEPVLPEAAQAAEAEGTAAAAAAPDPLAGFSPLEFADDAAARRWLADNTADLAPAQREAVKWYTGAGSSFTNWRLRQGAELPGDIAGYVKELDSAMSPLPADLVLTRMVGQGVFGDADPVAYATDLSDLAGSLIRDGGYTSTSLGGPTRGAGGKGVLMHIAAPEGTPAMIIGNLSSNPDEREILLGRGIELAVSKMERAANGYGWEAWLTAVPSVTKSAAAADAAEPGAAPDTGQAATAAGRQADAVYTVTGRAPEWALKWPRDREQRS